MEGTPLDRAYSASKLADAAVLSGDFGGASRQFSIAADAFEEICKETPETASARTLRALAQQHRELAEYFGSGRAQHDVQRHLSSPSASTYARPNEATAKPKTKISHPQGELDEAITALAQRGAAVFAKQFDTVVGEKLGKSRSSPAAEQPALTPDLGPSESFYLVKPKVSKPSFAKQSLNALVQARLPTEMKSSGLSNSDRALALERATNAQREVLKTGIQQLVATSAQKETRKCDTQLNEIDELRAENDKLRIQVKKLKSRWEDLKESARKRQTS